MSAIFRLKKNLYFLIVSDEHRTHPQCQQNFLSINKNLVNSAENVTIGSKLLKLKVTLFKLVIVLVFDRC